MNASPLTQKRMQAAAFRKKLRVRLDAEDAEAQAAEMRARGARPDPIVNRTFDDVVSATKGLLQQFTFDVARPKTNDLRGNVTIL